MRQVQTRSRFHITKAGYALVKELIRKPEFLFEDFTPEQVNRALGKRIPGATYFGLRGGVRSRNREQQKEKGRWDKGKAGGIPVHSRLQEVCPVRRRQRVFRSERTMSITRWVRNLFTQAPACEECGGKMVCPFCGSTNMSSHGHAGIYHRHRCKDCDAEEAWTY